MELLELASLAPETTIEVSGFAFLGLRLRALRAIGELRNVLTIVRGRPSEFWDESYEAGFWSFLKDRAQRPRHYAVAGLIQDLAPPGAQILELGCGYAPILSLLPANSFTYLGIDYSHALIRSNQNNFGGPKIDFRQAELPSEKLFGEFDVIVASEILYYLPLRRLRAFISQLKQQLKKGGILIVTMNKNPKAHIACWILNRSAKRIEKIIALNESGSRWTICAYVPATAPNKTIDLTENKTLKENM